MLTYLVPKKMAKNSVRYSSVKVCLNMSCVVAVVQIKWWLFSLTKSNLNTMVTRDLYLLNILYQSTLVIRNSQVHCKNKIIFYFMLCFIYCFLMTSNIMLPPQLHTANASLNCSKTEILFFLILVPYSRRRGPSQGVPYVFILWYVSKIIHLL